MPPLKWVRHDAYAIKSSDGRYSICRIGEQFEAWQTRAHEDGAHLIATNLADAETARRLVAEHDAELANE